MEYYIDFLLKAKLVAFNKVSLFYTKVYDSAISHRIGGNCERRFLNNFSFSIAKIDI